MLGRGAAKAARGCKRRRRDLIAETALAVVATLKAIAEDDNLRACKGQRLGCARQVRGRGEAVHDGCAAGARLVLAGVLAREGTLVSGQAWWRRAAGENRMMSGRE